MRMKPASRYCDSRVIGSIGLAESPEPSSHCPIPFAQIMPTASCGRNSHWFYAHSPTILPHQSHNQRLNSWIDWCRGFLETTEVGGNIKWHDVGAAKIGVIQAMLWGGMRLLVLGESHYHETAPIGLDLPDMTEEVMARHLNGGNFQFFSRVEKLVMGATSPYDVTEFWHSVAFYNYVPVVAANGSRKRPPEKLWYGQAPYLFQDLIRQEEVEAILVCGTQLWRRMPAGLVERRDAYQAGRRSWREREYEVAMPYRAVAAHIPHPSGSFGWSYDRCEPVVKHLRNRVDEIRRELGVSPIAVSSDEFNLPSGMP